MELLGGGLLGWSATALAALTVLAGLAALAVFIVARDKW
jgi:hypothetical protein